MANQTATQQPPHEMGPGAKVGVAVASALGIVALFSIGLWIWWQRRQKRQMAKEMVNFVDGDIVNLVDGGRFEKPFNKPAGAYDPYYHGNSSSSVTPSPVYFQPPAHFTEPPIERPPGLSGTYNEQSSGAYYEQPSSSYNDYYAPFPAPTPASMPSLPPSRDMPSHVEPVHVVNSTPPPTTTTDSQTRSNAMRHPWSPPDYDVHLPLSASSLQQDTGFHTSSRPVQPRETNDHDHYPIIALPAILPDPRPEPQAELPDRDIRRGDEQELPAPEQLPPRRQGPLQGNEIEEQKFLLSDMLVLREQKSKQSVQGNPPG